MDARRYLFISYKHDDLSTHYAREIHQHFAAYAEGLDFSMYMDDVDNTAGCEWAKTVNQALECCSHFLVVLTTSYWLSQECRRELSTSLARFEATQSPRLLFVLAQDLRPDLLKFDSERRSATLESLDTNIKRVADIHFLGPFDTATRLVRLSSDPLERGDQYAQLLNRFEATLSVVRR